MKIRRMFAVLLMATSMSFLCSCFTVGTKFTLPDAEKLQLGKLQPADCLSLFGKPTATASQTTTDANYVFYRYEDSLVRALSVSERALVLEFKDGKLNGYFYWSSFNKDKTKVDMKNVDKLKAGVGKLTEGDVLAVVGKPNLKAFCPTFIDELKQDCGTNKEVWGWYMRGDAGYDPHLYNISKIIVWFDAAGKVSRVDSERNELNH